MAKLLHIESSPRKDRSASIAVARAFLDEYRKTHTGDTVETLDLWKTELPSFDGDVINSKYIIMHGKEHTPEQKKAWGAVEKVIAHSRGWTNTFSPCRCGTSGSPTSSSTSSTS